MNKTWIIISSVVLVFLLVLGGVWWYLLMNGRPESLNNIPNPFGTSDDNEFAQTQDPEDPTNQPRVFDTTLRKLTGAAIAGAVFVEREGNTYVRYAERGTGHLFEIDLGTGQSTRLSNTTVPRTTEAVWSPQGLRVVLISETSAGGRRVFAGSIERTDAGDGAFAGVELDSRAANIDFADTGETIYYTTPTTAGSAGYAHNLITDARTERFASDLRDITVAWSPSLILYTRPSAALPGYVYEGTGFTRKAGGAPGLMALPAGEQLVLSYAHNGTLVSYTDTLEGTELSLPVFPEKCAADPINDSVLWCGAPIALPSGRYPDQWYQGTVSFNDILWQLDTETGAATLVSIPSEDVGEAVDAIKIEISEAGDLLLFINKKDGSLWLQEIN